MNPKELDYKFENVGQFRAIMSNLGYSEEYNNGTLKFSKDNISFTTSIDEIRGQISSDISPLQDISKKELVTFFNANEASNNLESYKDLLQKEHNISIHKWADLKHNEAGGNSDGFTIIDNNNRVCYTDKSLYDYAIENGYLLDGAGTQLKKGEYSQLKNNTNNKLGKYYRGEDNSLKFHTHQHELVIPKTIYNHKLTKENIAALKNGEYVAISREDKNTIFLKVDKGLNIITIRNLKDIKIPNEIGGHTLSNIDKSLLANGKHTTPLILEDKGNYFTAELAINGKELLFKNTKNIPKEIALQMRAELSEKNKPESLLRENINQSPIVEIDHNKSPAQFELKENKLTTDDVLMPSDLEQKKEQSNDTKSELSIDDLKVLNAIKTDDFQTIHKMMEEGYKPSESLLKEVDSLKIEENKRMGIDRLLGVEKQQKQKVSLKEELDPGKGKSNIKQPLLNTVNSLMNNM